MDSFFLCIRDAKTLHTYKPGLEEVSNNKLCPHMGKLNLHGWESFQANAKVDFLRNVLTNINSLENCHGTVIVSILALANIGSREAF